MFEKNAIKVVIYNILNKNELMELAVALNIPSRKSNITNVTSKKDLQNTIFAYFSQQQLFKKVITIFAQYYPRRIDLWEAKKLLGSISHYSIDELAKLYLHTSPKGRCRDVVWKLLDQNISSKISKDEIIELLITQLLLMLKEDAVTVIKNDLKVCAMKTKWASMNTQIITSPNLF